MPWTAPEVARPAMPLIADERTMLEAWLDLHPGVRWQKHGAFPGKIQPYIERKNR